MSAVHDDSTPILQPDPPSVGCLIDRFRHELVPMLRAMGFNQADAEDFAQDAIITGWLWMARAERIENWDGWLRAVTIRRAQKSRKRLQPVELTVEPAERRRSPFDELERQEYLDALNDALVELPKHLRELFVFCSVDGNTYTDAAQHFGRDR